MVGFRRHVIRMLRGSVVALATVAAVVTLAPTADAGQRKHGAFSDAQIIDGFRRTVFGVDTAAAATAGS